MYRSCMFCSADFGRNEALEAFPVGRQLAFDAARGRLWAVCGGCGRWNLAPIEERWETVDEAERLYHDTRTRVQRENIGLAALPDGTRLVRVGAAVPGELAAWRYGSQLLQRRQRHLVIGAGSVALGAAAYGGFAAAGGGIFGLVFLRRFVKRRLAQRVIYRIGSEQMMDGKPLLVRRWHLDGMSLGAAQDGGGLEVHIREGSRSKPARRGAVNPKTRDVVVVDGVTAEKLLSRVMVRVNRRGATRESLQRATYLLSASGPAIRTIEAAAIGGVAFGERAGTYPRVIEGARALALEMALHEESERRALDGELAGLTAAWREAEEIAAIADSLPGEALLNRAVARWR